MSYKSNSTKPWYLRAACLLESLGIVDCQRCKPERRQKIQLRLERLESLIMPAVDPTSLLVASGVGNSTRLSPKIYDANTGQMVREIMAYDPAFRGGVECRLGRLEEWRCDPGLGDRSRTGRRPAHQGVRRADRHRDRELLCL